MHICTHVPIKSILGVDPISSGSADIQRTDEPILPNFPLPPPPPVFLREGTNLSFSHDSRTHMYTRTKPWTECLLFTRTRRRARRERARARARSLALPASSLFFSPPLRAYVTLRNARTLFRWLLTSLARGCASLVHASHCRSLCGDRNIGYPLVSGFTSLDPPDQRRRRRPLLV